MSHPIASIKRVSMGTFVLVLLPTLAGAQSLADLRKLFDAGRYQQVVDASSSARGGDEEARIIYLAGQSAQKLSRQDDARRAYEQLAARPESDPWHDIGQSALALLSRDSGAAVDAANRGLTAGGDALPEAHFQAGLALSSRQDFAGAATHFDRAAQLDPSWAYAHYYAGLAYSKIKRIDLMASHFQTFLRLAPQAPERPEVQSIMKTLGGG